jgi:C-terminal processing protease CtpA/Prc
MLRLFLFLGLPALCVAQSPSDSLRPSRDATIDSIAALLVAQYVDQDTARTIAGRLRARSRDGAYTMPSDSAFAHAVTEDLRSVNGDLHLSLRPTSPVPSSLQVTQVGLPSVFLPRVEIFDGNIGLIELQRMPRPTPEAIAAIRGAFDRLANVAALIIDLRGNAGGSGLMNDTLWSYFVSDSQPTAVVDNRAAGTTVRRFALPRTVGPRFDKIPVFLLTSIQTGSAAEGFSMFLQQSGRAKTVGSRTAGAGHMVGGFVLPGGYVLGVSVARVRNARTGKEWERTGVLPDIEALPELSEEIALRLARAASRSR